MAKKKKSYRKKKTIPLAPLLGVAMPLANEAIYHFAAGQPQNIPKALVAVMTGYDLDQKNWQLDRMLRFWLPAGIGIAAHKLAGMLGINRALGRAGVPLIRI